MLYSYCVCKLSQYIYKSKCTADGGQAKLRSVMDCKEFERLIPAFINQELDYKTLKRFRKHVTQCPDCKEELVIQFLVIEGMARLEEGNAFDLQGELDKRIYEAERKVKFHNGFVIMGFILELLSMLAIVGVVLWIIL